jgi:hypothetical protein
MDKESNYNKLWHMNPHEDVQVKPSVMVMGALKRKFNLSWRSDLTVEIW